MSFRGEKKKKKGGFGGLNLKKVLLQFPGHFPLGVGFMKKKYTSTTKSTFFPSLVEVHFDYLTGNRSAGGFPFTPSVVFCSYYVRFVYIHLALEGIGMAYFAFR